MVDIAELPDVWAQLTGIIWARYFVIAGLFYWLLWGRPASRVSARRLADRAPTAPVVRHEIVMSLISSAIYAAPGALVVAAWNNGGTAIYTDVGGPLGVLYMPISILLYLFIHDTYFYWTHRAMHHPALFRAMHLTHHRSRQPTPWAAFSFHPWEAIISAWVLPAVAFVIPIHVYAVFALLIFITYCSVANHAGWEILPRGFLNSSIGRQLITASHHNLHHTNYGANLGLYFRFWDHVCGTDAGLDHGPQRAEAARPARAPEPA